MLLYLSGSMKGQCSDSSSFRRFRTKWNSAVEIFKEGTWKLPEVDFSHIKKDSFEISHPLQRSGINFLALLSRSGCIGRVSLLAKKDEDLDVQSMVAMMYLFEFFNHELTSADRHKLLQDLKTDAESGKKAAQKQIGRNLYIYEPGMIVNVLTVFIGH